MALTESDIIVYCAANMPEANGTTSGGAIDTTCKAVFTDIAATDSVKVVSSAAGDNSQTVTITGREASGAIVSSVLNLNGTTITSASDKTFERIMKIVVSGSHTGTITVTRNTGGATIATLEPGILSCRRLFYNAIADASGGSDRDYYEKIFIKNTNGTYAALSASVIEITDPSTLVTFDLEDAKNDNNSVANRLDTAPSGMLGSFNNSDKSVPGTNLGPGDAIGVWLKLSLPAGQAPSKNYWEVKLSASIT